MIDSKCYEDLFIAIWTTALVTDTRNAVNKLCKYAFDLAYEQYSLTEVNPLNKDSKHFTVIKSAIRKHSQKLVKNKLLPCIKQLIYEESQEWPNNKYTKKGQEYNRIFAQLRKEILEFAESEISKFKKSETTAGVK